MLRSSYVPTCFRFGRVILADKGDDPSEIGNWRPITIFSVVRRVIEKALDSVLRSQVEINRNQRGFVIGVPGCHVNSRLINACLKKAKRKKKNCVIVFLESFRSNWPRPYYEITAGKWSIDKPIETNNEFDNPEPRDHAQW